MRLNAFIDELEEMVDKGTSMPKVMPYPERRSKSGKTFSELTRTIKKELKKRPIIEGDD
jgi:hypothetical protein